MPRKTVPLSDAQIKNAKSKDKPYKLIDGDGLALLVTVQGTKLWRLDYRFAGVRKSVAFGAYPVVSLADARAKRLEAKRQIANGIDPCAERKSAADSAVVRRQATFEAVAKSWYDLNKDSWKSRNGQNLWSAIVNDVLPELGGRDIKEIEPRDVLMTMRKIESRGTSAQRTRSTISRIFKFAIAEGKAYRDPAADIVAALAPRQVRGSRPSITNPTELRQLLKDIDGLPYLARHALMFGALTAVRPKELYEAEWSEIDMEGATWEIPAAKMKMSRPHVVPLSEQAIAILKELQQLTGRDRYVFPATRGMGHMSSVMMSDALRGIGYQGRHCPHGWRATFRTIGDEILGFRPDLLEHQLAHEVKDPLGRAYNRTAHLTERVKMMQVWADYLDGLKAGAKVIPLRAAV